MPTTAPRVAGRTWFAAAMTVLLGVMLAIVAPTAAHAAELTASPTMIAVGESTTITATDLGGLAQASFGLGDNASGTFAENGETMYTAPVSGGTATVTFQGANEGTATIAVGDGETVLATVQVVVTAQPAPPQPAATLVLRPSAAEVGSSVTVTANGLGGLSTASIGLSDTSSGTFDGGDSTAVVSVVNGEASTTFTPAKAGTVTIAVGDGETVLATAQLTVTAPASADPAVTATPISAPVDTGVPVLVWVVIALVVLILIGAIVWIVTARRNRARRG